MPRDVGTASTRIFERWRIACGQIVRPIEKFVIDRRARLKILLAALAIVAVVVILRFGETPERDEEWVTANGVESHHAQGVDEKVGSSRTGKKSTYRDIYRAALSDTVAERYEIIAEMGLPLSYEEVSRLSFEFSGAKLYDELLKACMRQDAYGVIEWARSNGINVQELVRHVWAEVDLDAAIRFVEEEIPMNHPKRDWLILDLKRRKNPVALLEKYAAVESEKERDSLLRIIRAKWPENDIRTLANWLDSEIRKSVDGTSVNKFGEILRRISRYEPERAFEIIKSYPEKNFEERTLKSVLRNLAASRPWETIQSLDDLEPSDKYATIGLVAARLAESNVSEAWKWCESFEGKEFDTAFEHIVRSVSGTERSRFYAELISGEPVEDIDKSMLSNFSADRESPRMSSELIASLMNTRRAQLGDAYCIVDHDGGSSSQSSEGKKAWRFNSDFSYAVLCVSAFLAYKEHPREAIRFAMEIPHKEEADFLETIGYPINLWFYSNEDEAVRWVKESELSAQSREKLMRSMRGMVEN